MAKQNDFRHIKFTRLLDVLGLGVSDCMSKGEYIAVADVCRKTMEEVFLPPDFDVDQRIREDRATKTAYLRHLKSAREDLRWGPHTPPEVVLNPGLYAAETERVAKGMIRRMLVSSPASYPFFFILFVLTRDAKRHTRPRSVSASQTTFGYRHTSRRRARPRSASLYYHRRTASDTRRGIAVS